LISGVRAGDGQIGYGGGLLSFVEIHRWLVGFQGRADGYRSILGSDPETALTLGLLFGRRVDLGSTALDLLAGPAVAMRGANFSQTEPAPDITHKEQQPPPREPDVGLVPRLLFGAHFGFAPHSVFRTFVGVDGELGPRRGGDATPSTDATGRMPAFTLGLALGATLGTR
jgi:hypothetical protein